MKIVLSLFLILFGFQSFAQTTPNGCIIVYPYGTVASYPNVYSSFLAGVSVPTTQAADIQGKPVYNGQGPSVFYSFSCFLPPNPTSKRECAVRAGNGPTYSWYGGVFAQNYYQCPLDDYLFLLMLPIIGLGFYLLRKRQIIF